MFNPLLHDVGKLAMSDEELERLKTIKRYDADYNSLRIFQANFSERILENITLSTPLSDNVKYQFETFNGYGPFGLKGLDIPLGARILHIANLYDIVAYKMRNATLREKVVEFVNRGLNYLDTQLTASLLEQLKKE